jgi:acetaldehyde dehydrogenase/alcohol dehydrogenase
MMLERARWASYRLLQMDQNAITRIANAVADDGYAKAQHYAEWAVQETGYGVAEHKRIKNQACSRGVFEQYKDEDFVTPRIDARKKIVEIPRPAGVIFGVIPVTNPIATLFFKTLLALMTRNAILLSPHPGAKACCVDAAKSLMAAAKAAGAPDGVIQILPEPTIPLIEAIMADDRVDLIVATGGPAVVRAAYRSGTPAYGVGPGNAPVVVDESADIKLAGERIVDSKSFDNSVLCTNESTVLAFESIAGKLLEALRAAGAHVCSAEETDKVRAHLFHVNGFNTSAIGKDAATLAKEAGFTASGAKILVTLVALVQPEEKLIREKLCPVLAFAQVTDMHHAISAARSMMRGSGRGHSAAIHSKNETNILAFGASVPALRIVVNAGCSLGASGFETNLGPSMTIGTGFIGGSSIGDNLTPQHFLQFRRIAYNKTGSEAFGHFEGLDPLRLDLENTRRSGLALSLDVERDELKRELRKIIVQELESVLGE